MSIYLSNHGRSLTGDVKVRYLNKIIDSKDPYFLLKDPNITRTTDMEILLQITYSDVFKHLVLTKSFYTLDQFKAFKSFEPIFFCKWMSG